MPRIMSPKKKVQSLLNDLEKYRSQKKAEGQDMYHRLKEKYPHVAYYGIQGVMNADEKKMVKFVRHMIEVDLAIRCLEQSIYTMEEEMKKYDEQRR